MRSALLLLLATTALANNAVGRSTKTAYRETAQVDAEYWRLSSETGFLRNPTRGCLHHSLRPLCDVLAHDPSNSLAIAQAAKGIDAAAIIRTRDPARIEDAHHTLAVAQCRLGVNQPPSPTGDILVPYEVGRPLLDLSVNRKRLPRLGLTALVLDNCAATTPSSSPRHAKFRVLRTITSPADGAVHEAEKRLYQSLCSVESAFGRAMQSIAVCGRRSDHAACLLNAAIDVRMVSGAIKAASTEVRNQPVVEELMRFLECGGSGSLLFQAQQWGPGRAPDAPVDIVYPEGQLKVVFGMPARVPGMSPNFFKFMTWTLDALTRRSTAATPGEWNGVDKANRLAFVGLHPFQHGKYVLMQRSQLVNAAFVRAQSCLASHLDPACPAVVAAYDDLVIATASLHMAVAEYTWQPLPSFSIRRAPNSSTPLIAELCRKGFSALDKLLLVSPTVAGLDTPGPCFVQCLLDAASATGSPYCTHVDQGLDHLMATMHVYIDVYDTKQP